ncbi:hypothetical protein ACFTRD_10290 [Paenibacillus sp. NPDC056933]|uniref:hypothetical protein n=1 Tax=Paenibacillus sp. NPDC056933 TaxID=3345968 RepID=UPI0036358625
MTYSQRLAHGNSSDIVYLEHQIAIAEEELAIAEENLKNDEAELRQVRTKVTYDSAVGSSKETKMMEQLSQAQKTIERIRTRLVNLQEDLGKLGD